MEMFSYKTNRSCSRMIHFWVEEGIIRKVEFVGGCSGNTQGIQKLVEGMTVEEVIKRLKGIDCKGKGTSCPDQLAQGLEALYKSIQEGDAV